MKSIARIILPPLLLAASLWAATPPVEKPASPVIELKDLTRVTIDGAAAGTIVDAIANNANTPLRARLLDALLAWQRAQAAATEAAQAAAEESQRKAAEAVAAAKLEATAAEKKRRDLLAKLKAAAADDLAGEEARLDAELAAQKAALEAQIAARKGRK